MSNNEKKLREGSKAFKLLEKLRKHVEECFEKGDYKYDAALANIAALENLFKPYKLEFEQLNKERRQRELEIKEMCAKEGHVGEWIEDHYVIKDWMGDLSDRQYVDIPQVRWIRTCTRCGEQEVSETEPEEVKRQKKIEKIREMEAEIRKMKSELNE